MRAREEQRGSRLAAKADAWVAVVDHDPSTREALARLLRVSGLRVRAFADGGTFLDAQRGDPALAVVLEVHLPGLSGVTLCERLRQAGSPTHVVLMTGADRPSLDELATVAGDGHVLRKPFGRRELLDALREVLDDART